MIDSFRSTIPPPGDERIVKLSSDSAQPVSAQPPKPRGGRGLAALGAARFLPESRPNHASRLDLPGVALVSLGAVLLVWWLGAAASGEAAYNNFYEIARSPIGYIVGIGLTLNFFQHMGSGLRHLVMDTGAAYEIGTSKRTALATFAFSITMTAIVWIAIYLHKGL